MSMPPLRILGLIFSAILASVAWLGQVGPEQAMSNYSAWYELITNLDAPAWMDSKYVDVWGSRTLAVISAAGFLWFFASLYSSRKRKAATKVDTKAPAPLASPQNDGCLDRLELLYKHGEFLVKRPTLHGTTTASYDYIHTFPPSERFKCLDDWGPEVEKALQVCCTHKEVLLFTSAESNIQQDSRFLETS